MMVLRAPGPSARQISAGISPAMATGSGLMVTFTSIASRAPAYTAGGDVMDHLSLNPSILPVEEPVRLDHCIRVYTQQGGTMSIGTEDVLAALNQRPPAIGYFISQRLQSVFPDQVVFESGAPVFNLEAYAQ